MAPTFPVTIREVESRETSVFPTFEKMQRQLEKIDVENGEYEAWDAQGLPIVLSVGNERKNWLRLELKS